MTMTVKTVKTAVTIHTLDDTAKDHFTNAGVEFNAKGVKELAENIGEHFDWYQSAEGFEFWGDVQDRLYRIAGAKVHKKDDN